MKKIRYNHLNTYLKNRFGERTLKVCIDGGFSCPNRDGKVGFGGCAFCGRLGAGENLKNRKEEVLESIESQILGFLNSYRGERANKFIAYFQSFTNTYDTIENLKLRYDKALNTSDKFVGLEVATRPDCINEDIARLLASYKDKYYVCVELGLQTANDDIGKVLNRGYTVDDFKVACDILRKYEIDVVAHIMIGLPNETEKDILKTVDCVSDCGVQGVKFHSTYVIKDTVLEKWYQSGEYTSITQEYYVEMVGKCISRLRPDIIVHRINADPPREFFVAPDWALRKKIVINAINRELEEKDIVQGMSRT
jgi:radical SAM protein (TIGR01212 family)